MQNLHLSGLLLLGLGGQPAAAQVAAADTALLTAALANVQQQYARATQAESHLLTGTEYLNYSKPRTIGNQFFQSASGIAQVGTIKYDGFSFTQVPLLYDIKLDQVITPAPGGGNIRLIGEKVSSFTLSGHRFVRLAPTAADKGPLPAGFYEELVPGRLALLARRSKQEAEDISQQPLGYAYREKNRFFVQKDQLLYEVDNLKDILKALPDNKAELKDFARSNKLRFNADNREASAQALLRHYNGLLP